MRAYVMHIIITLATILISSGCGILNYKTESQSHKRLRLMGYDKCHTLSCGPKAISYVFKRFGINKSPRRISFEMQDKCAFNYRKFFSVISHDFSSVTCPMELTSFCKSYGFSIQKTKKIDNLTSKDTAIFLIKGWDDIKDWHWMAYPENSKSEIMNFFGEHTKLKNIYILKSTPK